MKSYITLRLFHLIIMSTMVFSIVKKIENIESLKAELEETVHQRNVYRYNFKLCKQMLK